MISLRHFFSISLKTLATFILSWCILQCLYSGNSTWDLYSSQHLQSTVVFWRSWGCCGEIIGAVGVGKPGWGHGRRKSCSLLGLFGSKVLLGESNEQGLKRAGLLMCKKEKKKDKTIGRMKIRILARRHFFLWFPLLPPRQLCYLKEGGGCSKGGRSVWCEYGSSLLTWKALSSFTDSNIRSQPGHPAADMCLSDTQHMRTALLISSYINTGT